MSDSRSAPTHPYSNQRLHVQPGNAYLQAGSSSSRQQGLDGPIRDPIGFFAPKRSQGTHLPAGSAIGEALSPLSQGSLSSFDDARFPLDSFVQTSPSLHRDAWEHRAADTTLPTSHAETPSSRSPTSSIEDEQEDDASIGIDDEYYDKDREWIEEDPTASNATDASQQKRKMKRFRLSHAQTRFLMDEFSRQQHPDAADRLRLSKEIPGLSPRQVQVWFQNRRAKRKRLNNEDHARMMRARVQAAAYSSATPHYPLSGVPLNELTAVRSAHPTHIYSPIDSSIGLTVNDVRRETEHVHHGRSFAGSTAAVNLTSRGHNFASSAEALNGRISPNLPSHLPVSMLQSPMPISHPLHHGSEWQSTYPGSQPSHASYTAYPQATSDDVSAPLSSSQFLPSTMPTEASRPVSRLHYDRGGLYAGFGQTPDTVHPAAASHYQMELLHTSNDPDAAGQYGAQLPYSMVAQQQTTQPGSSRRHDSMNEWMGASSASHADHPMNLTSSHMPHYHHYNG